MKGPASIRRGRHGRRRQGVRSRIGGARPGLAALLLVAAAASVVVVAGSEKAVSAAPQAFSGTCPGGSTVCIQVTLPCQTSPCPSVVAGPTQNLATDQYVYLSLSNYPAGDTVRIAYCATDGSGTIEPDPNCATNTSGGIKLSKQFVVIGTNGSTTAAIPVAFDPPGQGNPPLPALPLVQNGNPATQFFCDNGPEFCDVVITDDGAPGSGPTNTAGNTLLVPLDFSPGASACPASDPLLFTDSAFTVEHLLPAAVQATCTQKNGVVALNTATNTQSEINDLATGNTPVAFTDDPWDTTLNQVLTSGKSKFAYIPVALSATVVGFLGGAPDTTHQGVVFPLAHYNMTPNMVAGVLTTAYEGGGTVDSLVTAAGRGQATAQLQADCRLQGEHTDQLQHLLSAQSRTHRCRPAGWHRVVLLEYGRRGQLPAVELAVLGSECSVPGHCAEGRVTGTATGFGDRHLQHGTGDLDDAADLVAVLGPLDPAVAMAVQDVRGHVAVPGALARFAPAVRAGRHTRAAVEVDP